MDIESSKNLSSSCDQKGEWQMDIKNVGITGAGIMGSGIAQVCALAGYAVVVHDISAQVLKKSKTTIEGSMGKLAEKGKIEESAMQSAMARIHFAIDLEEACRTADLIIEAVFENLALKHEIFRNIDKTAGAEAILATNTSAIPITQIASVSNRGERFIGLHFMNPVPLMKGLEIIRGQLTSDETFQACWSFVKKLGKDPVEAVDYAGFIVSRLLDVLMNEAVKMVQEGNRPEDIDKAMELCAGHPMGPCKLLDLVGAEIAMHGLETMARDFGERYLPHPLLKKRVLAGLLGRKTGQGFYNYK
jgi:3-hydroxybutyryl-CoA dehydrogenase